MRIACDNQVGYQSLALLARHGVLIVYRAHNERDVEWFEAALDAGAEVFVSPDSDIDALCNQHNKRFIRLKQGLKGTEVALFILKKLERLRQKAAA